MKRNNVTEYLSKNEYIAHKRQVAFHEAGHATGIHLNNKAQELPPVFFKIIFNNRVGVSEAGIRPYETNQDDCIARVKGGRLIEFLPHSTHSISGFEYEFTEHNNGIVQSANNYMTAFEADIINLLIGPLAEAKHVADTDDELFNQQLINLKDLKNYGGSSDLALANDYLQYFSVDKQQREIKLNKLYTCAFDFVNNSANWAAITDLADYIISSSETIIYCEEIISIIDQSVAHFQNQRTKPRYQRHE